MFLPLQATTSGTRPLQAKHFRNEARAKMLALHNQVKICCEGIQGDAQLDEIGTGWEDAEDDDIRKAMSDKERWISRTIQLQSDFAAYEAQVTMVSSSDLQSSTSNYGVIKTLVEDTRDIVDQAIMVVELADKERGLFTLQPAPVSLAEYPKFAGKDAQCFFTFEEKMRRCLKANRVPRRDQAAKLREQLSGHALGLVPESIQDVEIAFDAL